MTDRDFLRQYLPDGSSYNPNTGNIVFHLILPVDTLNSFEEDGRPSAVNILKCLYRCIELEPHALRRAALKNLFDCLYDRTTHDERRCLPNWFEST